MTESAGREQFQPHVLGNSASRVDTKADDLMRCCCEQGRHLGSRRPPGCSTFLPQQLADIQLFSSESPAAAHGNIGVLRAAIGRLPIWAWPLVMDGGCSALVGRTEHGTSTSADRPSRCLQPRVMASMAATSDRSGDRGDALRRSGERLHEFFSRVRRRSDGTCDLHTVRGPERQRRCSSEPSTSTRLSVRLDSHPPAPRRSFRDYPPDLLAWRSAGLRKVGLMASHQSVKQILDGTGQIGGQATSAGAEVGGDASGLLAGGRSIRTSTTYSSSPLSTSSWSPQGSQLQ